MTEIKVSERNVTIIYKTYNKLTKDKIDKLHLKLTYFLKEKVTENKTQYNSIVYLLNALVHSEDFFYYEHNFALNIRIKLDDGHIEQEYQGKHYRRFLESDKKINRVKKLINKFLEKNNLSIDNMMIIDNDTKLKKELI